MTLPRHCEIWLPGYVRNRIQNLRRPAAKRVWLTFADHYEPLWNFADEQTGRARVARWTEAWPRIAARHTDSAGRQPRYTFFYPEDEYRPHLVEPLEALVQAGIADVDIHIHHDGEGQQNFIDRMGGFIEVLHKRHGLLRVWHGRPVFGFIHGNWALDNSRPDGRYCGLNNEISLLRDLGCYADFTMPSGGPTQAPLLNTIYWVVDDPCRPKSYASGTPVKAGGTATGDLLMIPGPLGVRWKGRLLPRIEVGEIASYNPPSRQRAERWLALAPRVGDDVFIKLHTHGTQERHSSMLLAGGLDLALTAIKDVCAEAGCELYFASAWEMRRAVDAAVEGRNFSRDNKSIRPALEGTHT